jgi:hypothetical protein
MHVPQSTYATEEPDVFVAASEEDVLSVVDPHVSMAE